MERKIAALCRYAAVLVATARPGATFEPLTITLPKVADILGPAVFENEVAERLSVPGVATGMSWTSSGSGALLFIECSSYPGSGKLVLTGTLGDVLKESAQTALSWVRSNFANIAETTGTKATTISPMSTTEITGIKSTTIEWSRLDVHIHLPAGAIPKDGPSAGVALVCSLVSLFMGRCCRSDTAMSGEITLRGVVLPVGGIKEKVLAAHRAGIRRVILPVRNEQNVLVDIPVQVRQAMEFIYVRNVEHAIREAVEGCSSPASSPATLLESRL